MASLDCLYLRVDSLFFVVRELGVHLASTFGEQLVLIWRWNSHFSVFVPFISRAFSQMLSLPLGQ